MQMTVQQDSATVEQATESGSPLDDILRFAGEEPDAPIPDEEDDEELEDDAEGDEPEADADGEDDDADEPSEAIKPPVSLKKEQQAAFKQLAETAPELAKAWAESEAQRNEQVRVKTTEAAEATRNATTRAQAEVAAVARQYAAELEVYAEAFRPAEPDLALLVENPQAYVQQKALFDQMAAQHFNLMQQVQMVRGQAGQLDQAAIQDQVQGEQARLRSEWPEILDPAKQADLWKGVQDTGEALGFTPDTLSNANATEMLALKTASDWKAKADKWDAFQASKMNKVRAAKTLPRVQTSSAAPARAISGQAKADIAFQRATKSRSGDDYAAYFEATGVKL
jgi:ElaB/YqjD/DUF883 family membrane-anchored ribosome-binding protein